MGSNVQLVPKVGMTFESLNELDQFLTLYGKQEKLVYTRLHSKGIKNSYLKEKITGELREKLQITNADYKCKFGGEERPSTSTGERESKTYNHGCSSIIKIHLTKDKTKLEIFKLNLNHTNHPSNYQAFYPGIPEIRRLSPTTKAKTLEFLKAGSNTKLMKNKLATEHNKLVTFKDLANLKASLKTPEDNDLVTFVNTLRSDHDCSVEILQDEDHKLKAIFFATPEMQRAMAAWPEIIFLDGTYKLFNLRFTLVLLQALSGTGRAEIVGVTIAASEERVTLKWIATTFKNLHGDSCSGMRCMMTDKDLTERNAFKEVFPDVIFYLCIFHTLKTFKKTVKNFNLNKETETRCLLILEKLVKSRTKDEYDESYAQLLSKETPECVISYFNSNWHGNNEEWAVHNMKYGNYGQLTNNAIEATNRQIKAVCHRSATLLNFARFFFEYMKSQMQETDLKRAIECMRRTNKNCPQQDEFIKKYSELLTAYSFQKLKPQFNSIDKVTMKVKNLEAELFETTTSNKVVYDTTSSECNCEFRTSMQLPCRHIFAVRKQLDMTFFCPALCHERWTKVYDADNMRSLGAVTAIAIPDTPVFKSPKAASISTTPRRNATTVSARRKILLPIADQIVDIGSLSTGPSFEEKRQVLEKLVSSWRRGVQVRVVASDESLNQTTSIALGLEHLKLTESNDTVLESIALPSPARVIGRPRGAEVTTTGYYPRKQSSATRSCEKTTF